MSSRHCRQEVGTWAIGASVVSGLAEVPGWDSFVAAHVDGHHVQSIPWARFQESRGWKAVRVTARVGDSIVGGAQILVKHVMGLGAIGYLDQGPIVDKGHAEQYDEIIAAIERAVATHGIRILVAQPPNDDAASRMTRLGFGPTDLPITAGATVVVDLAAERDEVLARMKSKTRYNIRKGLKSDLRVRHGNRADVEVFHGMLESTAARQGFKTNPLGYFLSQFDALAPQGMWKMLLAEDESGPVSAILLIAFGTTVVYKRGAWSGRAGRMHPNELLHWSAMDWAKSNGYLSYDFDGIDRHVAELILQGRPLPRDAVQTVTRFKLGYGGDIRLRPGTVSYVPNPVLRFGHDKVVYPLGRTRLVKRLIRWVQTR